MYILCFQSFILWVLSKFIKNILNAFKEKVGSKQGFDKWDKNNRAKLNWNLKYDFKNYLAPMNTLMPENYILNLTIRAS